MPSIVMPIELPEIRLPSLGMKPPTVVPGALPIRMPVLLPRGSAPVASVPM